MYKLLIDYTLIKTTDCVWEKDRKMYHNLEY